MCRLAEEKIYKADVEKYNTHRYIQNPYNTYVCSEKSTYDGSYRERHTEGCTHESEVFGPICWGRYIGYICLYCPESSTTKPCDHTRDYIHSECQSIYPTESYSCRECKYEESISTKVQHAGTEYRWSPPVCIRPFPYEYIACAHIVHDGSTMKYSVICGRTGMRRENPSISRKAVMRTSMSIESVMNYRYIDGDI
jgi:hypothetical protein